MNIQVILRLDNQDIEILTRLHFLSEKLRNDKDCDVLETFKEIKAIDESERFKWIARMIASKVVEQQN